MEEKLEHYLEYVIIISIILGLTLSVFQVYRLLHKKKTDAVVQQVKRVPKIDDYTYVERTFPLLLN